MSNLQSLVSIIMPAYNSRATIRDSIQSVCHQTYENWELLIIDDCSQDAQNIADIVYDFHDSRIRYHRLSQNRGVAHARNVGISKANGRYLAFLDSDDLWHPQKLMRQINFMKKNEYAFSYTWYQHFYHDLHHLGKVIKTKRSVDYSELLKGNDIGCLTVMIDCSKIHDIIMPCQYHEDYITWLNILKKGWRAYSLPENLAYYRKGFSSLTSNKRKSLWGTWNVYRKSQNLSLLRSGYCILYYVYSGMKKHYLK